MDRADFYDVMNINNVKFFSDLHVNKDHSLEVNLLTGAGVTIATAAIDTSVPTNIAIGTAVTIGLSILYDNELGEGDYSVEHVLAEVYDGSTGQYVSMVTSSYYKIGIDEKGNPNKQFVKSVTKFFGYYEESVIQNADFLQ
ncbi:MAG: hypothetical protein V8S74_05130 [Lachnospirales bacterium]